MARSHAQKPHPNNQTLNHQTNYIVSVRFSELASTLCVIFCPNNIITSITMPYSYENNPTLLYNIVVHGVNIELYLIRLLVSSLG